MIYTRLFYLEEFKDNMVLLLDNDTLLADAVINRLLMKKIYIYMPLVYGKTKHSATTDIM